MSTITHEGQIMSIEIRQAPELSQEFLQENPVYLISANLPGCGSSTLAQGLVERIAKVSERKPEFVEVGQALRRELGVKSEDEFVAKLKDIQDPTVFDPKIYGSLPTDKPCIVDGKLATTAGPLYLKGRPMVSVNLTSNFLTSSKRVAQREGIPLTETLRDPVSTRLIGRMMLLKTRASHDSDMRDRLGSSESETDNIFSIDTSKLNVHEILEYFSRGADSANLDSYVPEWEKEGLKSTLASLAYLQVMLGDNVHPNDRAHYEYQYQSIRYNAERLTTTLDPSGIAELRISLKKSLVDCWFGLMMKQTPRFFEDSTGAVSLDTISHAWTPEYYKIAEGWPTLSSRLKDKSIYDPYAGAGTLVHLLVARGIPSSALLSDISYSGGKPIDDADHTYATELNGQMTQVLFDDLPSWYKPDFSSITRRFTSDSRKIDLATDIIDYVVTDPPYGKNYGSGGVGLLIGSLPEFDRISKEGSILLVPTAWIRDIELAGYEIKQLTGDVSRGISKLPVCYIHVLPTKSFQEESRPWQSNR